MTSDTPRDNTPLAPGGQVSPGTRADPPPMLDQPFGADSLYALRAAAAAHASQAGMREGRCGDLVFVVSELAANAVRHGAGSGRLQMWNLAGILHCRVSDDGAAQRSSHQGDSGGAAGAVAQDPAAAWPVARGHGLWAARQIADQLSLRSGPEGTIATVTFALPAARPSFHLTRHTRDDCTVLELAGDLDRRSAPELTAAIRDLTTGTRALRLVLDLAALTFWDSAGLAALITVQRHINDTPAATFMLTGMSDQFRHRLEALGLISQSAPDDTAGPPPGQITPPR